jgi:hypothetical protein
MVTGSIQRAGRKDRWIGEESDEDDRDYDEKDESESIFEQEGSILIIR